MNLIPGDPQESQHPLDAARTKPSPKRNSHKSRRQTTMMHKEEL